MAGSVGPGHAFSGCVAIAGIGATEFSKASGRSELRLAVEAVDAALKDAGLKPADVQGMVTVLFASIENAQRSPMLAGPVHWPELVPDGLQYTPTPAQFCAAGSHMSPIIGTVSHLREVPEQNVPAVHGSPT